MHETDFADLLGEDWRPEDGDSVEQYGEPLDYDVLGDYGNEEQTRENGTLYQQPAKDTESALAEAQDVQSAENPEDTKESTRSAARSKGPQHPTPPRPRPRQLPTQPRMHNNARPIHGYPRPFGYQQHPPYQQARPAPIRQHGAYSGDVMGPGYAGMRPNDGRPFFQQQRGPQNYQVGWTGAGQNPDGPNGFSRFPNPMQIPGNSMNSSMRQMGGGMMPVRYQINWTNSTGYGPRPLRPPGPSIHVNPRFNRGMLPFNVQENDMHGGPNARPVFSRFPDRPQYPSQPSVPNHRPQGYTNQFGETSMNFPPQTMMNSSRGRYGPQYRDWQWNAQYPSGSSSINHSTAEDTKIGSSSQSQVGPGVNHPERVEESNMRKRRQLDDVNDTENTKRTKVVGNSVVSPSDHTRPPSSQALREFPANPEKGTVVSISNLAENVKLNAIEELGRQIGPILGAKILPEGTVAEIAFESPESAKLCRRKLHKSHFNGTLIRVNIQN
ncbi:hypothetical protein BJ742DRAFT_811960 [Cladochytrium replicatum]|nr:hypothetical protein BJ742DRAFT_811960 [Cladochytrium replicatum]